MHGKHVTILIPQLVGEGMAGSIAVGISPFVVEDKNFKELSAQVNIDLGHLENSLSIWKPR